eukprot:6112528-Prymnesium_polylepis.1
MHNDRPSGTKREVEELPKREAGPARSAISTTGGTPMSALLLLAGSCSSGAEQRGMLQPVDVRLVSPIDEAENALSRYLRDVYERWTLMNVLQSGQVLGLDATSGAEVNRT